MKRKYQTVISVAVIIAFFLCLHWFGLLQWPENFIARTMYGITSLGNNRTGEQESFNERLSDPLDPELLKAVCMIDSSTITLLEEENSELRKQLSFFSRNAYSHVGAEVVGRTVDPLGTIVTLNHGSGDGITPGHPVIVGEGVLVGVVIGVTKDTSFVRLINDNASRIGATLLNTERTIGLVEGGYGIGVRMNFIPQNEVVAPGDTIVTSGLTEGMPQGLTIGRVEVVEKQSHEPFQQAVLNPLADLSYLTVVSVLKTSIPSSTPNL